MFLLYRLNFLIYEGRMRLFYVLFRWVVAKLEWILKRVCFQSLYFTLYPLVNFRVQVPSPALIFLVTQETTTSILLLVTSSIDYLSRYSLPCTGFGNFIIHVICHSNNEMIIKLVALVPVLMLDVHLPPLCFAGTTGSLFP